jgi:chorismate-pyruvate lyase
MTVSPVMTPAPLGRSALTPYEAPWAALLGQFYRRLGLALPAMARLEANEVPQPYRRLLVHSNDMTPTLGTFHRSQIRLRVLGRECESNLYRREVVLLLEASGKPVEYGAICIHLQHLPEAARRLVLAERLPFGQILEAEAIAHLSWPQTFFAVTSDEHMGRLIGADPSTPLHGRRNILVDGRRRLLAEVLEILAPVTETPSP